MQRHNGAPCLHNSSSTLHANTPHPRKGEKCQTNGAATCSRSELWAPALISVAMGGQREARALLTPRAGDAMRGSGEQCVSSV